MELPQVYNNVRVTLLQYEKFRGPPVHLYSEGFLPSNLKTYLLLTVL